jgi:hypothetical protein
VHVVVDLVRVSADDVVTSFELVDERDSPLGKSQRTAYQTRPLVRSCGSCTAVAC